MDIKRIRELSGQRGLFESDEAEVTVMPVGKHNHVPDSEFDAEQLAMGIKVEMEHTEDPEIAKAIAKDHLSELDDYYTRLAAMVEEHEEHEEESEAKDDESDDSDDETEQDKV